MNDRNCDTCSNWGRVSCNYQTCTFPGEHNGLNHPCPDCPTGADLAKRLAKLNEQLTEWRRQ